MKRTTAVLIRAVLALACAALALGSAAASASQAAIHVTQNTAGAAGYYGADDNHTHYRFTETTVLAVPQLFQLNGSLAGQIGAAGTELCDPNTGFAAQTGLVSPAPGAYEVLWAYGDLMAGLDPCVQSGLLQPDINPANCPPTFAGATVGGVTCGTFNLGPIATGDHVYVGVFYQPHGFFTHKLSFGDCVTETNICRQTWSTSPVLQEFFEFGTGALTRNTVLTAPALNLLDTFTNTRVTCYACASSVPFGAVQSVTGTGGLTMAQFVNGSSQVVMTPDLIRPYPDGVDAFQLLNGSTSP